MGSRFSRAFIPVLLAVLSLPLSTHFTGNTFSQSESKKDADSVQKPAAKAGPSDPAPVATTRPDDKVVLGTGIVNVTVSVTDPYGRFVTGLSKEHFDVFDDKVKQQIAHFSDDDAPVSLGVVYDVSG
jgi:hypothetical protein